MPFSMKSSGLILLIWIIVDLYREETKKSGRNLKTNGLASDISKEVREIYEMLGHLVLEAVGKHVSIRVM
jgi:hypothetical protein